MTLPLYMDHNVHAAIVSGALLRGLDVLTAREDGFDQRSDSEILVRATQLGRIVFTHDTDFISITGTWLATGQEFSGVVFGHPEAVTIGKALHDLELICRVLTADEAANQLIRLPL